MSSRIALFLGAAAGAVVALNVMLSPRAFKIMMIGLGSGIATGLGVAYVNTVRQHSLQATFVPVGLTAPAPNYKSMEKVIFSHLSQDYENRGELDLGEESITVQPHVFAQIGILDIDGVRRMWSAGVIPIIQKSLSSTLFQSSDSSASEAEKKVVFCDIGSGVGNVCLQVLAETACRKTVGIDVIPSRVRAAEEATVKAKQYYPEIFREKEARWFVENLVESANTLNAEGVNVVFTHSWMFDDDLMTKLTKVIDSVPSISCVITSRRLDANALSKSNLHLHSLTYFSADWNDEAPFYVYGKARK